MQGLAGTRRAAWGLLLAAWSGLACALDAGTRFHDYVVDNWSIEQGLPQISVLSLTQDRPGYLWIGTQNGIARFDGMRFTVYDRDTTAVDTTMAGSALTDGAGRVWFGTPRGALVFEADGFREVRAEGEPVAVQGLAEDTQDHLLFATTRGVMGTDGRVLVPQYLTGEITYSILSNGVRLWVGGEGRVWRIDGSRIDAFLLPDNKARVGQLALRGGTLWLGTSAGLYRIDGDRVLPALSDPELGKLSIESLRNDRDGNLWIGTTAHLYRVRPEGEIERIADADFVRDSWIHAIYEDREGNLWLGSHTESLFRLWNGWARRVGTRDGLSDAFIWSVLRDPQGRMIFGTNSGVVRLEDGRPQPLVAGDQLPNPTAYELHLDHRGALWIGTRSGVARWSDGRVDVPPGLEELKGQQVNLLLEAAPDDWWIGTMAGLFRYRNGTLARIALGSEGSSLQRVRCLHVLGSDEVLVGTEAGVRHVRGDRVDAPTWAQPYEGRFVSRIAEIRPGLLGVATLDDGLGFVAEGRLLRLSTAEGLPSANGWTLDVLDGQLYVGTIVGVYRLPLASLPDPVRGTRPLVEPEMVISSSGRERGSQRSRCCNGGASARSARDGDGLWFASITGAMRLDTRAIVPPPMAPNVVVESVHHDNRSYPATQNLEIDSGTRDVEFQFTALAFRDPRNLRFRYRLDGYDAQWREAGTRRSAYYTNLPPGDYRFHVQASLSDRVRSGADAVANFRIVPRWYELVAFRVAVGACLAALLALLLHRRTHSLRRRGRELERAVAERTGELARANERLRDANLALAHESHTDALTGLNNRRYVLTQLYPALHGSRAALLLLDLDNFKLVNDRHGHAAGDRVLVQLAHLLADCCRQGDHLARWGGEEFLLLVRDVEPEAAFEMAERVRQVVAQHRFEVAPGEHLALTCSVGFAMYPVLAGGAADWHATLELADAALYRIKREGRNGCAGLVAGPYGRAELVDAQLATRVDALVTAGTLRWVRNARANGTTTGNVTPFPGARSA